MLGFFFFQAEDGIRDTSVTGVQTCALPISASRALCTAGKRREIRIPMIVMTTNSSTSVKPARADRAAQRRMGRVMKCPRSEERRVGKEGEAGSASRDEHKTTRGGARGSLAR